MKIFRKLVVTSITMILSSICIAEHVASYDSSPLLPDTTIIAGDPNKNEFFIVAKNDVPRIRKAIQQEQSTSVNQQITSQIRIAINRADKNAPSKKIAPVKLALNQPVKKVPERVPERKVTVITKSLSEKSLLLEMTPNYFAKNATSNKMFPLIKMALNHRSVVANKLIKPVLKQANKNQARKKFKPALRTALRTPSKNLMIKHRVPKKIALHRVKKPILQKIRQTKIVMRKKSHKIIAHKKPYKKILKHVATKKLGKKNLTRNKIALNKAIFKLKPQKTVVQYILPKKKHSHKIVRKKQRRFPKVAINEAVRSKH